MLFADGVAGLLLVGLWLFCIIDVVTTPESQIRNLPKIVWLFVVIGAGGSRLDRLAGSRADVGLTTGSS